MWKDVLKDEFELNGKKYSIWEIAPFNCGKRYKVHMEDDKGIHTLYFNKMELDYKNIEKRFEEALKPINEN
jgi:hypothetical protein